MSAFIYIIVTFTVNKLLDIFVDVSLQWNVD